MKIRSYFQPGIMIGAVFFYLCQGLKQEPLQFFVQSPRRFQIKQERLLVYCATNDFAFELSRSLMSLEITSPETYVAIIADENVAKSVFLYFVPDKSSLKINVFSWNSLYRVLPVSLQIRDDLSLIVVQRFFLICEVLKQYSNGKFNYSDIFWTSLAAQNATTNGFVAVGLIDAKDVVFQDNPWTPLLQLLQESQNMHSKFDVLVFAIEPQFMSLGSCKINRGFSRFFPNRQCGNSFWNI